MRSRAASRAKNILIPSEVAFEIAFVVVVVIFLSHLLLQLLSLSCRETEAQQRLPVAVLYLIALLGWAVLDASDAWVSCLIALLGWAVLDASDAWVSWLLEQACPHSATSDAWFECFSLNTWSDVLERRYSIMKVLVNVAQGAIAAWGAGLGRAMPKRFEGLKPPPSEMTIESVESLPRLRARRSSCDPMFFV